MKLILVIVIGLVIMVESVRLDDKEWTDPDFAMFYEQKE